MDTDISFTGTRQDLNSFQVEQVYEWLNSLRNDILFVNPLTKITGRHGVCTGADERFHVLAKGLGYWIVGHPGVTKQGQQKDRATCVCDYYWPEEEFLTRNSRMVRLSQITIAAPAQRDEQLRSGTWQSIRYCRNLMEHGVTKKLWIAFPDGSTKMEYTYDV